jgi:hypothetical protein
MRNTNFSIGTNSSEQWGIKNTKVQTKDKG